MNEPAALDFYFDFLSPFAFFAWKELPDICQKHGIPLNIHPVVFGKLLDHWGQLGPAEIPPKKENTWNYCYRLAASKGLAFNPPKAHPYNPLPSLRVALQATCGGEQPSVLNAIFDAGWLHGQDLGDPQALALILTAAGLDGQGLMAQTQNPTIKQALIAETQGAIERGVFGVPTVLANDELFWGYDQIPHLETYLEGNDPLDKTLMREFLNRPRDIERKRG